MGNEEPGYQVLPRSVLSNDNIRKQKFIGTWKNNSEAATIAKHVKDSDVSSSDPHIEDTQGT